MGILSRAIKEQLMAPSNEPLERLPSRLVGTYVQGIEGQPIKIVAARRDWFLGLIVKLDPTRDHEDMHAWVIYDDLIPIPSPAGAEPNYTPRLRAPDGGHMAGVKATFRGGPWDGQVKMLANPSLDLYVPLPLDAAVRYEEAIRNPSIAIRYVRYHRTVLGTSDGYREYEYRVQSE